MEILVRSESRTRPADSEQVMNTLSPDTLHRTAKLELDEGRAQTVDEIERIVGRYVLQVDVGEGVSESHTRQAMLLTAVNAASRAFIGGVRVRVRSDGGPLQVRWSEGERLAAAVQTFGGDIVESLEPQYPTLVIGDASKRPPGSVVLYATWEGWAAGVVEEPAGRLPESTEFPLAGVLAAALGVSEAFQHVRGFAVAGRRSIGMSLWQPADDWRLDSAYGGPCPHLPSRLWLVGLGHLGQAYAWAIGLLPYEDTADVELMLQDPDFIAEANRSTGMLSRRSSVGRRKTRVVAERLEALGFRTCITERPLDPTTQRRADEPGLALVGVDDVVPRRTIERAGFDVIVDAGLGGDAQSYLDILLHSFPSGIEAASAWPERRVAAPDLLLDQPGYLDLRHRLETTRGVGEGEGDIECGIVEVAGQSVGAAFVGCVAATHVLAEALRVLNEGPRFEVVSLSLRSPDAARAVSNTREGAFVNPGFVPARAASA